MFVRGVLILLGVIEVLNAASIDEIIINAAPKTTALSTFQMSPGGEVLVTVDFDLKLTIQQYMELKGDASVSRQKRKAIRPENYRWKGCKVYYEITSSHFDNDGKALIEESIAEWEKYTCLDFIPATSSHTDKVVFSQGSGGCYSRLGKVGGTQEIGLSRGCLHKGVIVHEIGHAIGWIHEQARPDRDQFIRVNFNRIPQEWHPQFEKFSDDLINDYRIRYDYTSIMHYSGNAVAPQSIETLDPKFQSVIGQREAMSFRDVMLANVMYGCASMQCPRTPDNCRSQFGQDAFLFKRKGDTSCTCFCPADNEEEIIKPCDSSRSTTTTTTTTAAPVVTTTTATTSQKPMECLDLRDDCEELVKADECKMDMERMFMFCKKSCKFCEKDNMCMDYDTSCPLLAAAHFCDHRHFGELMRMECPKSCQLCTPVAPCQMQHDMGLDVPSSKGRQTCSSIVLLILALLGLALSLH